MKHLKTRIEALVMFLFPRFYCVRLISYFLKRKKEDRDMLISFIRKSPEGILKQTEFRIAVGLGKEDYKQYLFAEEITPLINRICDLMKENDFDRIKNILSKQARDRFEFIGFSLNLAYDFYYQLNYLKKVHRKYEKLLMKLPENLRGKQYLDDLENQREEIRECTRMIYDCDLNGFV